MLDDARRKSTQALKEQLVQITLKLLFCYLLGIVSAHGQEHPVGRALLSFESPSWVAVEVPDKGVNYTGEVEGTVASETRMFINQKGDQTFQALLIARVSKGGIASGYFSYSPKCQDSQAMIAEGNSGFQQPFAQCLLVYPLFTTTSLLKQLPASEAEILKSSRIVLPDTMQLISAYYGNSNGSFVHMRILLAPRFKGLVSPEQPSENAVVAWGKGFMKAVKAGTNSFSGRIKIPVIEFNSDSVEKSLAHLYHAPNKQ
jgi:hypothetical protein